MKDKNLGWLFNPEPAWYGLRGSGFLWKEMREKFKQMQGDKTTEELKTLLYTLFLELTGHTLYEGEVIYVKKYDPGHGMSAGFISMTYWVTVAIPLLLKRFSEGASPFSTEGKFMSDMRNSYEIEKYPNI